MSTRKKYNVSLLTIPGDERPLIGFNGEIIGLSTEFDPVKCGITPIQNKVVKSKRKSKRTSKRKYKKTNAGGPKVVIFKDEKSYIKRFPLIAPSLMEKGLANVTSPTINLSGIRNPSLHPTVRDIENQLDIKPPKKSSLKKKGGKKKTRKYKKRQKKEKRKTRRIK